MVIARWVLWNIVLFSVSAWADLTIHLQTPFRDNATTAEYTPHIVGGATDYNPGFGAMSKTIMTSEGDGWFTYTWKDKTLGDFQDWMSFSVKACPNTTDNNYNFNNCVEWKAGEFKMGAFFGTETELWIYTEAGGSTYTKSFMAPGSKIVWFKSPWGNKALPQMIFGADSVLMRYAEGDKQKCGWFYGAITPTMMESNPLKTAYFTRYKAPWLAVPADKEASVNLASALASQDTIFVDGTVDLPSASLEIGAVGECFDPTRRLHIYHPWRTNTTYRDSTFYIKIDNNIMNTPTGLSAEGEYKYWRHYDFEDTLVGSSRWNSPMAKFQILRGANEWPQHPYFQEMNRPSVMEFFPTGVYETWLFTTTSLGDYDLVFYPLEPKVVRLMSPWENMSPSMIVVATDDIVKMGPIPNDRNKDTCGWYEGIFYKHTDDWKVYFRQSFGMEKYGGRGIVEEGAEVDSLISLDSAMAKFDTTWVYPFPLLSDAPKDTNEFPGRLGICPTLKISALVVDWAGESHDEGIDVDFGNIVYGNPHTTMYGLNEHGEMDSLKACSGLVTGMVQDTLVNGVPARLDSSVYPWYKCAAAREVEKWFIPEVVAKDASGKEYTNATCRDIKLSLDEEGFWLADFTNELDDCNDTLNPGFYPIDDFKYLDSAQTVLNPKFDWDISGCRHNYSFAMKVSAQFKYVKGQYFEFRGDDDVWVYINNRLVVDIGGCHNPEEGAVNLDTIGQNNPALKLIEGREYPFHIFFSERNATGSNFKMRTSINLQTQKTYYPVENLTTDGTISYTIYQLLTDESISCDVSSVTRVDTTLASSMFVLSGGSLPATGVDLQPGLHYGGIMIDEKAAGFVIDTNAIVRNRGLAPGSYCLQFFLLSDLSQSGEVFFTVPAYPLPEIAFADVFGGAEMFTRLDPSNINLRGQVMNGSSNDTLLTHVAYPDTVPIKVAVLYMGEVCKDCFSILNLKTSDPLSFLDKNKMRVNTLESDSTGMISFYVVGESSVSNASFLVSGETVQNSLVWKNIHFKEPPVPFANNGSVFDRNGDGVPDSIVVPFSKSLDEIIPDTIAWSFGSDDWHTVASLENVKTLVKNDSMIVVEADSLLTKVFTGNAKDIYTGSFRYHYTYIDKESGELTQLGLDGTALVDKIGAILTDKPIVKPISENVSRLKITLSECVKAGDVPNYSFLELKDKTGAVVSPSMYRVVDILPRGNSSYYDVYFQKDEFTILPEVGFMVRLVPGAVSDLSGNTPHVNNPWLRIEGEQRVGVEPPGLVFIDPGRETPWVGKGDVAPVVVDVSKTIDEVIAEKGLPGQLIKFDLGEVGKSLLLEANGDASVLSKVRIKWEVEYFSGLGQFVNSASGEVACSDKDVFGTNCVENSGNIFLMWNGRSNKNRLVGTGVYITKLKFKIFSDAEVIGKDEDTYTLGIRRRTK